MMLRHILTFIDATVRARIRRLRDRMRTGQSVQGTVLIFTLYFGDGEPRCVQALVGRRILQQIV